MTEARDAGRATFDEAAELYERARPGYPDQLFDDLHDLTGLGAGSRVLEVGCGTGKATRALARRGYRVLCVELGANLAAVARRELASVRDVRVVTAPFETWDAADETFDMVFAATAWHWIDPGARYRKAASVLRDRGALATVATSHAFPPDADPLFRDFQDAYESVGEARLEWPPPPPEAAADDSAEIDRSGLFETVGVRRYLWARDYTADDYVSVLETYSGHRLMAREAREELYSRIRELIDASPRARVRKHYLNVLVVARRL